MQALSSEQIAAIVGSDSKVAPAVIAGVSTDSRKCGQHDVFIAISGEKFDGHDFVPDVIAAGCPLVIVNRLLPDVLPEKQIVVTDTLIAYGKIGAYNRSLFKGKVIGLTGSAGKTTTKEELKFALTEFGKVYATVGNHNNFIGVPESLCNMDLTADFAVIEMGMSSKGEISRLTSFVKPDIAIITNVYPMHIEFFKNLQGIAEAKAEIFEGLPPKGGIAIINADTNYADILEQKAAAHNAEIVKFGQNHQPKVKVDNVSAGEHCLYNAWCVLKTVEALGLNVAKAAEKIKTFEPLEGRGKPYTLNLSANKGTYTLIDDSYSGQPEAMKLAIKSLNGLKAGGRKIAVLGKMAELGACSKQKHIEIGRELAKSNINIVVGVCPEMKDMLAELPPRITQYYFENKDNLADFLLNQLLQNKDIVLIKGARYSSKLYQVADELKEKGLKA